VILTEAIGLGLLLSLYLSEVLGFVAGGLVVPGYFVVISSKPMMLLSTIGASLLSLLVLKLASRWALIYGRRRALPVGGCWATPSRRSAGCCSMPLPASCSCNCRLSDSSCPELLAYWMDKQGNPSALGMLSVVVTMVRLLLIVIHGGDQIL